MNLLKDELCRCLRETFTAFSQELDNKELIYTYTYEARRETIENLAKSIIELIMEYVTIKGD